MISDSEYLERIVGGIHAATSGDAEVRWNEGLNGRQFDVVVRFQLGTLRYLVLIEVKNRTRPASAMDIEAFVTKTRDQLADKAVFVTAAGFQDGAVAVARRHGVDLFTLSFDQDDVDLALAGGVALRLKEGHSPEEVELAIGEPELVTVIERASLTYTDRQRFDMPSEASQMTYYAEKTLLADGRSIGDLIMSVPHSAPALDEVRDASMEIVPPLGILPPDSYFYPAGDICRIELKVAGRMSRMISGNVLIEPSMFRCPVIYTNVLTGEVSRYTLDQLPLNMGSVIPGQFYFQLHPLRYFQCASISGDLITWRLIESFQRGQLIRATYTQDTKYGAYYVPVSNREIVERLNGRLHDYLLLARARPGADGFRA